MKSFRIFIILSILLTILVTSCSDKPSNVDLPKPEIGFTPIGVPLRISINTSGSISVSYTGVLKTPIGDFDISTGSLTVNSIQEQFPKQRVLIVRVDNKVSCYDLEDGKEFIVDVESDDQLYKRVRLDKQTNGDIILEIESVSSVSNQERPASSTDSQSPPPSSYDNSHAEDVPFFMIRPITEVDLYNKSGWELDIMRNEIYARHGRRFNRQDLQDYFNSQSWYKPMYSPEEFDTALLTPTQCQNAIFIKRYQGDSNVATC